MAKRGRPKGSKNKVTVLRPSMTNKLYKIYISYEGNAKLSYEVMNAVCQAVAKLVTAYEVSLGSSKR